MGLGNGLALLRNTWHDISVQKFHQSEKRRFDGQTERKERKESTSPFQRFKSSVVLAVILARKALEGNLLTANT